MTELASIYPCLSDLGLLQGIILMDNENKFESTARGTPGGMIVIEQGDNAPADLALFRTDGAGPIDVS
jgi:hypothetical protein